MPIKIIIITTATIIIHTVNIVHSNPVNIKKSNAYEGGLDSYGWKKGCHGLNVETNWVIYN